MSVRPGKPHLYTLGTGGKSAEEFFGLLKKAGIERVIDIRLHNTSQLAGFTKKEDLKYFLLNICGAEYIHETLLSPTDELMDGYKKREFGWDKYRDTFLGLMRSRGVEKLFTTEFFVIKKTALLCSEPKADKCHRQLVAELLSERLGLGVLHL